MSEASIKSPSTQPGADRIPGAPVDTRNSTGYLDEAAVGQANGDLKIHEIEIVDIVAQLESNADTGLTAEKAKELFEKFGPNELEKPPRISLFMLFIVQLNSVIMYLLLGAVVASAAIKASGDDKDKFLSYIDSIAILIIVLINATIAAVTENSANDALEALANLQTEKCDVIRGDPKNPIKLESRELVPGDIVMLGTGDVVPADVRCITANDLRVNEMLLTGEPEDVGKNNKVKLDDPNVPQKLTPDNMAFSSSNVKAGSGKCIVTSTGMRTRVGTIAALLNDANSNEEEEVAPAGDIEAGKPAPKKKKKESCIPDTKSGQSPLQANLELLAVKLGYMAIAVCLVVFIVGVAMGTKDPEDPDTPSWLFMILVAVTLTVAAIPEGLPLCVTIALSSGCASMVKQNVLMRKIAAVETLGSASIICTDKTGTLTEGKMTLVAMHAGSTDFTVTGKGFNPEVGEITSNPGGNIGDGNEHPCVIATLGSAVLCSNTTLKKEKETNEETGESTEKWVPRGNSSEAPLVVAAQKIGVVESELEVSQERVFEIPFSSSRKMMVTITKTSGESKLTHVAAAGSHTAHVKGAPNYILEKCTQYLAADGSTQELTAEIKAAYTSKVDDLSSQALRVLAIAVSAPTAIGESLPFIEDDDTDTKFASVAKDLTLCGLCASIDPERDGVKGAVLTSRIAGCRVVMITGDYLKTAQAIAKNINILNRKTFVEGNGEAVDCGALRPDKDFPDKYLPNSEIDKLTEKTNVFARAKPEDKLEIVKSLQRQGKVCAMTGDGVNDAPALARADIGVAMGLEGTEVAKGASDMILTDDNFCSIVKAIEQGRIIYAGIQKFVSFIMSVHFAEVVQIFLCIVSSVPVMRQPLQILFLILVTDLPPSIALGFEPGEELTMKRQPRPKTQPVVVRWMWLGIVANGMILTICIFSTYMLALWAYAGAFLSDDIIDPTRSSCTIWPKTGQMTPSLDYDCAIFSACSAIASSQIYHKDCGIWQNQQLNGVNVISNSFTVRKGGTGLGLSQSAISTYNTANAGNATDVTLGGATGAMYQAHGDSRCDICISTSIRRARTSAFISLVWAEGFRAYVSRSFDNGFWVDTFKNPSMNKAVLMAQATLFIALYLPGLSTEVLGLYPNEIHGFGWFIAIMGALSCLVICEVFKCYSKQFVEFEKTADYEESEDGTRKSTDGAAPESFADAKAKEIEVHIEEKPAESRTCGGILSCETGGGN